MIRYSVQLKDRERYVYPELRQKTTDDRRLKEEN